MDFQYKFLFTFSAIVRLYLPIKCPVGGGEAVKQCNSKNFYSIALFALVNSKYRFIWGT